MAVRGGGEAVGGDGDLSDLPEAWSLWPLRQGSEGFKGRMDSTYSGLPLSLKSTQKVGTSAGVDRHSSFQSVFSSCDVA